MALEIAKSKLENFIKKYSLNGEIVSVTFDSDGKELTTAFASQSKTLIGEVKMNDFVFDVIKLGIFDTDTLKKLLGVLGDDITIDTVKNDVGKLVALKLTDKEDTSVNFMLADLSVIPKPPSFKALPTFDVSIPLTKEFINKFIKAKGALSEVETFTLLMNPDTGKMELILGYADDRNTNRIRFDINPEPGKDKLAKNINFSAKFLKEVFSANTDATSMTLHIATAGLAKIELVVPDFSATYYMVEIDTAS